MKQSNKEWEGHFEEGYLRAPYFGDGAVAIGCDWTPLWNANSHCVLQIDDLFIYDSFTALFFLHAHSISVNIITFIYMLASHCFFTLANVLKTLYYIIFMIIIIFCDLKKNKYYFLLFFFSPCNTPRAHH